ncbi:MAG TPA: exopolysaccharide biosynthesis polyprenyl glycosylphosphotransferase [Thermoleophilaceae bacterium]|nr:exopolysaccharide biosynthesis polyprenyl glycosylphosphotransferase [Thermoleophilaceae bacterium]
MRSAEAFFDAAAARRFQNELKGRGPAEQQAAALAESAQPSGSARIERRDWRFRRMLACSDALATFGALLACLQLLGNGDTLSWRLAALIPLVILIGKLLGLYDRDELVMRKSTLEEAPALLQVVTLFVLLMWIAEKPLALGELGGDQVLVTWLTLLGALLVGRVVARRVACRVTEPERCLLLGDPAMCDRARARIDHGAGVHAEVVGEIASARIGEQEVPLAMLAEIATQRDVQRVVIAPRSTDHGDVLNLVRAVKSLGLHVSVLPRLLEVVGSSVVVDDVAGLRVLGVRRFGLTRSSLFLKRGFDILGAGVGLVFLAPLMALVAAAIKLDSNGQILFRQPRIGKEGRPFTMVKFRTMVDGAEAGKQDLLHLNETDGLFKIGDDPRITRVGRLIRRTSVDELPQLLNVLRGEMSLVGPRPLVMEDDSRISGWDRRRLHLTPGMTGPWQVLGPARIPLQEMVKLDYLYVATWSLWGDVKILLQTISFVFRREGV